MLQVGLEPTTFASLLVHTRLYKSDALPTELLELGSSQHAFAELLEQCASSGNRTQDLLFPFRHR